MRFGMLCGVLLACGGSSVLLESPPVEDEPAPRSRLDLSRVQWPQVAEPLPTDVPWWAAGLTEESSTTPKALPQLADPYTLYTRAANNGVGGELGSTVLVCLVRNNSTTSDDPRPFFRSRDRARADLMVLGEAAGGPTFAVAGEDNTRSMTLTIPVPALGDGDQVQLRLRDRDFIRHDHLGTMNLTYHGTFPIEGTSGSARAECRALESARVVDRGRRALDAADQEMASLMEELGDVPPSTRLDAFAPVVQELEYAVAWLGWASPDIQLRRARLDALIETQRDAIASFVRDLPTEASLPGGGRVRFREHACREEHRLSKCFVSVSATGTTNLRMRVRARAGELANGFGRVAGVHEGDTIFEIRVPGTSVESLAPERRPFVIELQPIRSDEVVLIRVPSSPSDACLDACEGRGLERRSSQCHELCTEDCATLAETYGMNEADCEALQTGQRGSRGALDRPAPSMLNRSAMSRTARIVQTQPYVSKPGGRDASNTTNFRFVFNSRSPCVR